MSDVWRLIIGAPARGAWNMAADEAILEHVGRGETIPTVRLYAWEPACLSLGHAQPFADIDLDRLRAHGWEMVRRPTGGRAILHTDELTYSVIAPNTEPRVTGSILESYNRLASALLPSPDGVIVAEGTQGAENDPIQFRHAVRGEVGQDLTLGVGPEVFHRVQFRRIGRQEEQLDSLPMRRDPVLRLHGLAPQLPVLQPVEGVGAIPANAATVSPRPTRTIVLRSP